MRKSIVIVSLPLLLISGIITAATTGKITGTVIDAGTRAPLPGVKIVVEETIFETASAINGTYVIPNIPAGTYSVSTTMAGYKKAIMEKVKVSADLTTSQDFILEPAVLENEAVIVEADRALIQKDITASRTILSGDEMLNMPVDNFVGALTNVAGVMIDDYDGDLHFRGGREHEVAFLIDNVGVDDPLAGNNGTKIPNFAIEEIHIITGGMSAEYGNAQSGLINLGIKDGSPKFKSHWRYTTSDWGLGEKPFSTVRADEVPEKIHRFEFGLTGPDPILTRLLPLPGSLNYLLSGELVSSQRRFPNQDIKTYSGIGKLTYRPTPRITLRLLGLSNRDDFNYFSNLWKKTIYEDRQDKYAFRDDDGDGRNDNRNYIEGWFGNGILDTEDINRNGLIDYSDNNNNGFWDWGEPTEDLNGNGVLDYEDLNHNGTLDKLNMLDHLADVEWRSNLLSFTITHQITDNTFYEIILSRFNNRHFQNAHEQINEDIDGDGKLDILDELIQSDNGLYEWDDLDNDGYFDRGGEDLNGNGILDEYGTDLFTDRNHNGYVDASEIGPAPREYYRRMRLNDPESSWMSWADIPYQGQKDYDGYYTYGLGTTWDRTVWYLDKSTVNELKFDFDSQVTMNHNLRAGLDVKIEELFKYEAKDLNGYGDKYNMKPTEFAAYFQDKLEYKSLNMNIGLRYDYFDANWDRSPNNIEDPTWDRAEQMFIGNEDENSNGRLDPGEDLNGNGVLDQSWEAEKYLIGEDEYGFPVYSVYPGDIKDPRKVPAQDYWSPRFGVSLLVTKSDKFFFNYGRYFSRPIYTGLYMNLGFDTGGGFPVTGNSRLGAEKVISYETGFIHAFKRLSTIELTGFFKDYAESVNSELIYYTVRDWYIFYSNQGYGSVRGLEITYTQRPTTFLFLTVRGVINYTLQAVKISSSNTLPGYFTEWSGNSNQAEDKYAEWDQRHTVNLNLDLRTHSQMGPLLSDWSANFLYRYGSGTRWTPPRGQDRAAPENTRVLPPKHSVDVRFGKLVPFGNVDFEFILDIRNLFDRKNVVAIADEEWYAADQDGDGKPDYDPQGKYDDPTVYSRGRLVRLILQTNF